jgi:large repetitive protein
LVQGVAKEVIIHSVKVFNDVGYGTVASAIAGLEYVIKQRKDNPRPAVANLSFGLRQEYVTALEDALTATLKAGVTIVTSSGNHGGFDCDVLPSNLPGVISVAASTYQDESAQYNDLGRCIDLFAPGDRITGLWVRDDYDTVTISGSSIASAHVAGAAALVLEAFPYFTPEHVRLTLLDTSEEGVISGIPSYTKARNNLLNTGILTFVPEYDGLVSLTSG